MLSSRTSTISVEAIQSCRSLIETTTIDLEAYLDNIQQKLETLAPSENLGGDPDMAIVKRMEDERLSTEKGLQLGLQLSQYIDQIQSSFAADEERLPHLFDPNPTSKMLVGEGLDGCKDRQAIPTTQANLRSANIYPASDGASDRETDLDSIFSESGSLAITNSSPGTPGIQYSGIKEVAGALLSHPDLRSLYATAISTVDEKKCRAHLKGFLKAYAKGLKKAAGDYLETKAATFIESMAGRVSDEIRRTIVSRNEAVQLEEGPSKRNTRE